MMRENISNYKITICFKFLGKNGDIFSRTSSINISVQIILGFKAKVHPLQASFELVTS